MPTTSEKKALLFVAAVLLLGATVRSARTFATQARATTESRASLLTQIGAVEKARTNAAAGKVAQKSKAVVNVNRATVLELQALPRVGPVLAQRIKAYRDSAGPIANLEQLDKVKGIGPAMLKELAPRVTFQPDQRPSYAPLFHSYVAPIQQSNWLARGSAIA